MCPFCEGHASFRANATSHVSGSARDHTGKRVKYAVFDPSKGSGRSSTVSRASHAPATDRREVIAVFLMIFRSKTSVRHGTHKGLFGWTHDESNNGGDSA